MNDLDAQLSPSRTVERLDHYLWLYNRQSELARASFGGTAELDVAYGPDPRHRLDYFPCGTAGAPLLVFVHGGFWQALSKDASSFPAPACRSVGFDFAAIGYRLGQTTPLAGIVADVARALTMLGDEPRFGFDRDRVVVAGHSAGAHLAAMMLVDGTVTSLSVRGGSLIGGVFDLEPVRRSYVNEVMRLTPDEARALSPVAREPRLRCPVLITYAQLDTVEFARQSTALAAAWAPFLPVHLAPPQPGLNHFNSPMDLADPESHLFTSTVGLLAD
jgi:arylformamidase